MSCAPALPRATKTKEKKKKKKSVKLDLTIVAIKTESLLLCVCVCETERTEREREEVMNRLLLADSLKKRTTRVDRELADVCLIRGVYLSETNARERYRKFPSLMWTLLKEREEEKKSGEW